VAGKKPMTAGGKISSEREKRDLLMVRVSLKEEIRMVEGILPKRRQRHTEKRITKKKGEE